jgi:DMSO/TMAO reductase YedYZ molybdopterin-dependent catalytic subunit
VVGELAPSGSLPADDWRLVVEGEVEARLELSYADLLALPQSDLVMDVHCVTGWTRFGMVFTGIPLADLFRRATPSPRARFVRFVAYSDRNHDTSLPLDVVTADCWLVHQADREPLAREHGGPVRVVTRNRYFYKSLKWVRRIILLEEDVLGYWERESAYHNHACSMREERYDDARVASREQTERFRSLEDFEDYRHGRAEDVLIKANLSNWTPKSRDLRGVCAACS